MSRVLNKAKAKQPPVVKANKPDEGPLNLVDGITLIDSLVSGTFSPKYSQASYITGTDPFSTMEEVSQSITGMNFIKEKEEEEDEEEGKDDYIGKNNMNSDYVDSKGASINEGFYAWNTGKRIKSHNKSIDFKYFLRYTESKDISDLLKFLIKEGFLSEHNNCMMTDGMSENSPNLNNYVNSLVKSLIISIKEHISIYNLSNSGKEIFIHSPLTLTSNLTSLIRDIFMSPKNRKVFLAVDTLEVFQEVIKTCIKKGIKIEEELLSINYDFLELRKNTLTIKLIFLGNINELILIKDKCKEYIAPTSHFYYSLDTIPDLILENDVELEKVEINGVKYNKDAFVTMVECDFDAFISNLDFESTIANIKNVTKEIKEKELL